MLYILPHLKVGSKKGRKIHGHGQQCGDWGWGWLTRGLNDNGKKYNF